MPPEPTVTILKRPSKDAQNASDSKVFQPKKTLQQREQAYAEARLRILGEASPEKLEERYFSGNIQLCHSKKNIHNCRISIQKPKPSEDNVIRLPKGPDGTQGFSVRR